MAKAVEPVSSTDRIHAPLMGTPPGGYKLTELAEAPGDQSRFARRTSPNGEDAISPGWTFARALEDLVGARVGSLEGFTAVASFDCKWADADGVRERGTITGPLTYNPARPGKVWRKLRSGKLLDSFALGGDAWKLAPDAEVYQGLSDYARDFGLIREEVRRANDSLSIMLAARAGLKVTAWGDPSLPHPFPAAPRPKAGRTSSGLETTTGEVITVVSRDVENGVLTDSEGRRWKRCRTGHKVEPA